MTDFSLQFTTRRFALGRDACGQPSVRPLDDILPRVETPASVVPFARPGPRPARTLPAAEAFNGAAAAGRV